MTSPDQESLLTDLGRLTLGLLLLSSAAGVGLAQEPPELPRICWQRITAPPAAAARLPEWSPGLTLATDGAHPPAPLEAARGRRELTVYGDSPQLFVRWPDGGLLQIWARHRAAGVRRMTARLADGVPESCALAGEIGAVMLTVEAVSEGAGRSRSCVAWSLAAGPPATDARWPVSCVPVAAPDLVGMPLDRARELLEKSRLRAGQITRRPAAEAPDRVVGQSPAPAASLITGQAVDLVVAATDSVVVPDLRGLTPGDARSRLERLGVIETGEGRQARRRLLLQDEAALVRPRFGDYRVAAQRPAAGREVAVPGVLEVELRLRLPDLRGRPAAEAARWLCDRGLEARPAGCAAAPDPAAQASPVVVEHRPGAGELVAEGAVVTIVSRLETAGATPPGPLTVPDLIGRSPAAARRLLDALGLRLERRTPAVATGAAEEVIGQQPGPGDPAVVPTVLVDVGVRVPDIENATVSEAEELLRPAGLTLRLLDPGVTVDDWRREAPPHRLRAQVPGPGAVVDAGDPRAASVAAELHVRVPEVVGQPLARAVATLKRAAFEVRTQKLPGAEGTPCPPRAGGSGEAGRRANAAILCVLAQTPAFDPGRYLRLGAPVTLGLGQGDVADPPDHDWFWFWFWSLVVLALLAALLTSRLRARTKRVRPRGVVDFGTQAARPKPGGIAPPAISLRPRLEAGRQSIRVRDREKGQEDV